MSLDTLPRISIEDAPKPDHRDPLAVGEHLINLLHGYLSYHSYFYEPDMALEKEGGNCFAWANIGAAALERWEFPSGIVLTEHHAHIVSRIMNHTVFIDPLSQQAHTAQGEATRQHGVHLARGLGDLYEELVTPALSSGARFAILFGKNAGDRVWGPWQVKQAVNASEPTAEDLSPDYTHMIFSADQADTVLNAIGDLTRYKEVKPEKFYSQYGRLTSVIPQFVIPEKVPALQA